MNSKAINIIALLLMLFPASAFGQLNSIGTFNSPKGFGLRYETSRGSKSFDTIVTYADISGMLFYNDKSPGVIARYSHLYRFSFIEHSNSSNCFYFGPGMSFGYVPDVNTGYGFAFAVNCTAGWRFIFPGKPLVLDLDFTANLGLHIRREGETVKLALFKRGIYETIGPQLSISYIF